MISIINHITDPAVLEKAVGRYREKGIILPTLNPSNSSCLKL
jgi:hypothetical protein